MTSRRFLVLALGTLMLNTCAPNTGALAQPRSQGVADLAPIRTLSISGHGFGAFGDPDSLAQFTPPGHLAFSPDGRRLLSFDTLNTLKMWDTRGAGELRSWTVPLPKDAVVTRLGFGSAGSATLILQRRRADGAAAGSELRRLDLTSGKLSQAAPVGLGTCATFQPAEPGADPHTAACSPDRRLKVFFVPRGQGVAAEVYDVASGRLRALERPNAAVKRGLQLSFSPNGKSVAAVFETLVFGRGGTRTDYTTNVVQVLDLHSGRARSLFDLAPGPTELRWLPGGEQLLTLRAPSVQNPPFAGGQEIKLWDVARGVSRWTIEPSEDARDAVPSPDGRTFAVIRRDSYPELRGAATGQPLRRLGDAVTSFALSADGETIVAGLAGGDAVLLSSRGGREQARLAGRADVIEQVALSPDGTAVATASRDGTLKLWSANGKLRRTLPLGALRTRELSFSCDGKVLAARVSRGNDESTLRLWRVSDGRELKLPPQGKAARLHFTGASGELLREEIREGRVEGNYRRHTRLSLLRVAGGQPAWAGNWRSGEVRWTFSPDGRAFALGAYFPLEVERAGVEVRLADARTGASRAALRAAPNSKEVYAGIGFLALAPDHRTLLAYESSGDGCGAAYLGTRLFDLVGKRELPLPPKLASGYNVRIGCGLGQSFPTFAFSGNGRFLAARAGNAVTLWGLPGGVASFRPR